MSESPPGAQVAALYEAAGDETNEAGWRGNDDDNGKGGLRVAVVVTGSHFAEAAGFDSTVRRIHLAAHCPPNQPTNHENQFTVCLARKHIRRQLGGRKFACSLTTPRVNATLSSAWLTESYLKRLHPNTCSRLMPIRLAVSRLREISRVYSHTSLMHTNLSPPTISLRPPRRRIDPNPKDTSTWTIPHGVTVPELQSRLSSTAVHPLFLLTDASLEDEYRALVGKIGFGTVAPVNQTEANATGYNDEYLSKALRVGLEVQCGK